MKKIEIARKYFTEDGLERLIALCGIYCIDGYGMSLGKEAIREHSKQLICLLAMKNGLKAVFNDTYTEKIQFYDEDDWSMEFRIDGLFLKGVIEE